MPTLVEIAKLANVSRSTVSRVINNDSRVKQETRKRVQAVISELNFQPNRAARSLAGGRTHVLGLVIPMGVSRLFTDPYFPLLIQGVTSACNAHDYSVMLWLAEPEYERRMINQILHSGLIDGVIVSSSTTDDPLVDALHKSGFPFILVGRTPEDEASSYIDVDNVTSAKEAIAHLLRRGRRRIATITGPQTMIAGVDRLTGYRVALRERGLMVDPNLIADGDFTEAGGYEATRQLLGYEPDAIFVASDVMAIGALRALREAEVRVPEDIALIGFDDMPFAQTSDPPLTTVRQPIQKTGSVAVETLIDLIEHPGSTPRRILLPTELVIRSSD